MPPKNKPPSLKKSKSRFRRKRIRQAGEPSAIDLIEEGVNLLRRTPLSAWTVYLCGAVPFLLGFLMFWTEMASSGLAHRVQVPASLGLACLFIWFKLTQVYFAKGMREALLGKAEEGWSLKTWLRILRVQAFWQPMGLIAVPIAMVLTLPFPSTFAFFQNILVTNPEEEETDEEFIKTNFQLARLWPEQNWMLLTLFSLVAFLSWLNWLSVLGFIPFVLKSLMGIETVFSRVGAYLFNSTSLFACCLLSFLVTDPVIKAVYLLRRHYSESRKSGADLRLQFKRSLLLSRAGKLAVLTVLLATLFIGTAQVARAETVANEPAVDVNQLDDSIDEVLERREFVWRFPREEVAAESEEGWVTAFFDEIDELMERIQHWFEELFESDDTKEPADSGSGFWSGDFVVLGQVLSYLVIFAFVLLVIYFAVKAFKNLEPMDAIAGSSGDGLEVVPDLDDEDVSADMLPRNRWVELARELIAKGEYRLALRAYFLAQLSEFSSEGLIVIQKAKSNRDYARELSRRGHGNVNLVDIYRSQMRLFESIWYGGRVSGPSEIHEMEDYLTQQGVLL